ncbi:hypothetical protein FACS1894201_00210 [Bacteroidia bacterium]|nr:hypothetical protein FACS1894201_00210 [Bacteroidia bacterium]
MKTFLVPIDLSQNALYALDYAVFLANKVSAEIILIWVNDSKDRDDMMEISSEATKAKVVARLDMLVDKYKPLLTSQKIGYRIREGHVDYEVANQAKYDDIDLVICATHGFNSSDRRYTGNNAVSIVMQCDCPVITIRPHYNYNDAADVIVVPVDSSSSTIQKAQVTCHIAKALNAQVHLVCLYSSNLSAVKRHVNNNLNCFCSFLSEQSISYSVIERQGRSTVATVLDYANEVNAAMLITMTEQEALTTSLLIGTTAQHLLNEAVMPVVGVNPKLLNHNFKTL